MMDELGGKYMWVCVTLKARLNSLRKCVFLILRSNPPHQILLPLLDFRLINEFFKCHENSLSTEPIIVSNLLHEPNQRSSFNLYKICWIESPLCRTRLTVPTQYMQGLLQFVLE